MRGVVERVVGVAAWRPRRVEDREGGLDRAEGLERVSTGSVWVRCCASPRRDRGLRVVRGRASLVARVLAPPTSCAHPSVAAPV